MNPAAKAHPEPVKKRRHYQAAPATLPAAGELVISLPVTGPQTPQTPEPDPAACLPARGENRRSREDVLPISGEGDNAAAWGDTAGDNDQRLQDGVPPHWGRL